MTHRDIVNSINLKIENSTYERFTIAHVIDELNNTYRDIANKTDAFETSGFLKLEDGRPEYTLPDAISRPTRAVFRGRKIDFISQEAMDLNVASWETDSTGDELTYLVYNNLSDRLVKPYPRLTDVRLDISSDSVEYLGELSGMDSALANHLWLNLVTGAKYVSFAPFGTISGFNFTEVVTIYGSYLPPLVTELGLDTDDLHIEEIQANALIYGTAGNLLFTSGRTEDASKGQNFLRMYGVDESDIAAIRKKDFSGGFRNTARNQHYRTPFDK